MSNIEYEFRPIKKFRSMARLGLLTLSKSHRERKSLTDEVGKLATCRDNGRTRTESHLQLCMYSRGSPDAAMVASADRVDDPLRIWCGNVTAGVSKRYVQEAVWSHNAIIGLHNLAMFHRNTRYDNRTNDSVMNRRRHHERCCCA